MYRVCRVRLSSYRDDTMYVTAYWHARLLSTYEIRRSWLPENGGEVPRTWVSFLTWPLFFCFRCVRTKSTRTFFVELRKSTTTTEVAAKLPVLFFSSCTTLRQWDAAASAVPDMFLHAMSRDHHAWVELEKGWTGNWITPSTHEYPAQTGFFTPACCLLNGLFFVGMF